ncbi:MAG TPA: GNAT family N-acetyltransferase [Ktedonobacterales bacterium]|nr:GNAT family N-acetyltransferase [Ktedonobacterales bacterium]
MTEYRTLMPIAEELRGEQVVVRAYRPEDAEALREAVAESRDLLRPWMPFADDHQTIEETRDFILRCQANWLMRHGFTMGVFESRTGRLLGGSGYTPRDWDVLSFEIGYWLRAGAEGHGYITESTRLITDYLFDHLHAQRVQILCDARNTRSAAVPARLGFPREALLRHYTRAVDGDLEDTLIFAMIPSDPRWPQRPG